MRVAPHIIDRVLGHLQKGMRGTYNHYQFEDEKREALLLWEAEVMNATADKNVETATTTTVDKEREAT